VPPYCTPSRYARFLGRYYLYYLWSHPNDDPTAQHPSTTSGEAESRLLEAIETSYPPRWFTPPRFRSRRSGSPKTGSSRVNRCGSANAVRLPGKHLNGLLTTDFRAASPRGETAPPPIDASSRRDTARVRRRCRASGISSIQSNVSVKLFNRSRRGDTQVLVSFPLVILLFPFPSSLRIASSCVRQAP
jgi:hypothetical protein